VGGRHRRVHKLAHHLQDEITQARMVPHRHLYTRLSRTARDAAKVCGKSVIWKLVGEDTRLDNNIVEQITDPLIHLVRIPSPTHRRRAGAETAGSLNAAG